MICRVPGVQSCSVSLLEERAEVEYDPQHVRVADILEAIEDVGFEATLQVQVGCLPPAA